MIESAGLFVLRSGTKGVNSFDNGLSKEAPCGISWRHLRVLRILETEKQKRGVVVIMVAGFGGQWGSSESSDCNQISRSLSLTVL